MGRNTFYYATLPMAWGELSKSIHHNLVTRLQKHRNNFSMKETLSLLHLWKEAPASVYLSI